MHQLHSFDNVLHIVDNEIKQISYNQNPKSLFEPITYVLSLGGKRVRPALTIIAYSLYKDNIEKVIPIALGIEIFHNFTLLHDDLMDKADIRRGKPAVHKKWNDNVAILSGDAMVIESYREICKVDTKYLKQVLDLFSQTASEICCGQQLDMEFEQRMDVTIAEYIEMIRLKTAVLLGCALKEGAYVADADSKDCDLLYQFGINIGLAFQIKDDLLDVYGNTASFGKKIGGDILCNKKTYLLINALLDNAEAGEVKKWIEKKDFDEQEKIKAVTAIYDKLDLKKKSEELISEYYKKSLKILDQVSVDTKRKKVLYELAEELMIRNS